MSKRGNENISGNSVKFEKSATRMSQRGSYVKMRSHERLSGGADAKSKSNASVNKSTTDTNPKVTPVGSETSRVEADAEGEIKSILEETSSHSDDKIAGDKKVNEMIDYVILNLQEAGKALASLGENFEHDLKLMIVEIMGKVQNCTSLAHVRLDAAQNDLETLRRELVSRSIELVSKDGEIADLKAKLNEIELSKVAVEKALAENIQKSSEMIQSSTNTAPSHKPLSGVSSSEDSPEVEENAGGLSETQTGDQSGAQVGAESGAQSGQMTDESGRIGDKSGAQIEDQPDGQLGVQSGRIGDKSGGQIGDQSDGQLGVHSGKIRTQSGAQVVTESGAQITGEQSGGQIGALPGAHQVKAQTGDSSRGILSTHGEMSIDPSATATAAATGHRLPGIQEKDAEDILSSGPGQQPSGIQGQKKFDRPSTTDVAVQSGRKDGKRSSDLESEVARLRKENERIIREKTDYENAIQRALLRGVSSLNAETLKVLKCPPVSCYSPCRPPPSPVNATETMMPCFPKSTRDNWTPRGVRTSTNGTQSTQGTTRTRSNVTSVPEQEIVCCGGRTTTNGIHKSGSKQKKSSMTSDNSMVFLLHQAEASSVCVSGNTPRNRASTRAKLKKPENSICVKKLG